VWRTRGERESYSDHLGAQQKSIINVSMRINIDDDPDAKTLFTTSKGDPVGQFDMHRSQDSFFSYFESL